MSSDEILERLKKLEVDLDERDTRVAELQKKTVDQANVIDGLKEKFDKLGTGAAVVESKADFTTKTWFCKKRIWCSINCYKRY